MLTTTRRLLNEYKKVFLASIAASVFIFIFDMLWHGFLMGGMYQATASVWRPEAEMNASMPLMMATQFLMGFAMTFFYSKVYKGISGNPGLIFGLGLALVSAPPMLSWYCHIPVPFTIPALWAVATALQCIGCGLIIAKIYK